MDIDGNPINSDSNETMEEEQKTLQIMVMDINIQTQLYKYFSVSSVNYIIVSCLTPYQVCMMQLVSKKFYQKFVPIAQRQFALEGSNTLFGSMPLVRGQRKAVYV